MFEESPDDTQTGDAAALWNSRVLEGCSPTSTIARVTIAVNARRLTSIRSCTTLQGIPDFGVEKPFCGNDFIMAVCLTNIPRAADLID
jgi:hypothetical protein